jgi:hypothetical protein
MSCSSSVRRRPLFGGGAALLVLVSLSLAPRAVGAQDSVSDVPELAAVYFQLEDGVDAGSGPLSDLGANRPARYQSFTVVFGDRSRRMGPVAGSTGIRLSGAHAGSVTAQIGDTVVGLDSGDFGNQLADALAATRVDRFARFGQLTDGGSVTVDLTFARPLADGDVLLLRSRVATLRSH